MRLRPYSFTATILLCTAAAAAPQPLENFARRPYIHGVTISADGRYVAFLSGVEDDTVLMTLDRNSSSTFKRVTTSEPDKFDLSGCRWANEKRLLCSLYGNIRGKKFAETPFRRLFAVDGDGKSLKVLEQARSDANLLNNTTSMRNLNMNYGSDVARGSTMMGGLPFVGQADYYGSGVASSYVATYRPERQDNVLDLTPGAPDTVLIQADDDRNSYPSIFNLNINSGQRVQVMSEKPPMQFFVSDGNGTARLGWGLDRDQKTVYFTRPDGKSDWQPLGSIKASDTTGLLRPIAMAARENTAYAVGPVEGRNALWSIDLTDQRPPRLLFKHPLVDVGDPILKSNRQLLGVRYDVERPYVWYADSKLREVIDKLERRTLNQVHEIVDSSTDLNTLVVRSSSDVEEGSYYVYVISENRLQKLGNAYPELDQRSLGTMTNIVYKAADGTEIPGYLTVPSGAEKKNLPLVVLPHDGPVARDTWKFSFLRTFLANRGYAVLQMNYRGSQGFGQAWQIDAQKNWADVIHSDIQDATRWAVSEGIADPKRICIMGWGFGGYEALLSATRNGDTYKCAVSIGGIADLQSQREQAASLGVNDPRPDSGSDSPLANAAKISIPVLLVHGNKDWQVQVDQTNAMQDALVKLKKPHTVVVIKGAGHELERKSDRITLLKAVEKFLAENLGSG
jgi:dipeptidyl aminopeptidase/acylaminoacyl peptidase